MPGTVVRVRGIKRYFERKTGKWYCYHRATGKRIQEEFGSPEFFVRLADIEAANKHNADEAARPGTLKALILSYKQTDRFNDLAPRTRADYEKIFVFLEPLWDTSLRSFTTQQLAKLRDKWCQTRGRRYINYVRAVLSVIFGHGVEIGVAVNNPVTAMKMARKAKDSEPVNRPWTLAERQVALKCMPPHLRLPLCIALFSGMREGDILRLPTTAVETGRIKIKTAKRGVWIDVPILPELNRALTEAREHSKNSNHSSIRLCVNSRGKPWTLSGFSCSFRKELKKLEKQDLVRKGLTFHGLRHTVASVLAESGVSAEDIAAVLGQRSSQMASHYSREADRSQRTHAAIKKFKPLGTTKRKVKPNEE